MTKLDKLILMEFKLNTRMNSLAGKVISVVAAIIILSFVTSDAKAQFGNGMGQMGQMGGFGGMGQMQGQGMGGGGMGQMGGIGNAGGLNRGGGTTTPMMGMMYVENIIYWAFPNDFVRPNRQQGGFRNVNVRKHKRGNR